MKETFCCQEIVVKKLTIARYLFNYLEWYKNFRFVNYKEFKISSWDTQLPNIGCQMF